MTDDQPDEGQTGPEELIASATTETVLHGDLAELPQAVTTIQTGIDGVAYAVSAVPGHGLEVERLDWRDAMIEEYGPNYATDTRRVTTVQSLLDELARRPLLRDQSTLWSDSTLHTVKAIYDDHPGGLHADFPGDVDPYRRGGRRVDQLHLELAYHEDWLRWGQISGREYNQEQFGDLMEEMAHTIVAPGQREFADMIDNIRVSFGGKFETQVRRQDGRQHLVYLDTGETSGGDGNLELPEVIKIRTRVFDGAAYEIPYEAWFRTRREDKKLWLKAVLKPRRQAELAVWDSVVQEIRDGVNPGEGTLFPVLENTTPRGGGR